MRCHVYRSSVREGLYVYVAAPSAPVSSVPATEDSTSDAPASDVDAPQAAPDGLDALPAPVRRQLGRAELAMTLELDEHRRLGQEDVRDVLGNLAARGFHVQMPRDIEPLVEAVSDAAVSSAASRRPAGERRD